MKSSIQKRLFAILAITTLALVASRASAEVTIVYPNEAKPLFSIQVPNNWKFAPAQADDQFFQVAGPAGVEMWFRAKSMTSAKEVKTAVDAATKSGKEWLATNYADVVFEEVVAAEREGTAGFFSLTGKGIYKRTGDTVTFTVAFIAMPNGALAEFWSIIPKNDLEGPHFAKKVLESFQAR